ncbi:cysteine-rich receptor-like protein kinase 8 [Tanacetum coccineum]
MVTVRALLAIAAMNGWDICQMDVSNAFLHGNLFEEVYMQMPQSYVGQGENVQDISSTLVCKLKKSLYSFKQAPRQWFAKLSSALLSFGYVQTNPDYSLLTKSDKSSFTAVLVYVDDLHWFNKQGIFISQKKYTLDLLIEVGLSNAKAYKLPMDSHVKLQANMGTPLPNPESNKQRVVSRSLAEAEYRVMALTCCEVTWLLSLLKDLGLKDLGPVDFKCDNKATIYIAANLVFHARTKHIEIGCHYVRDQVIKGEVLPSHVSTKSQLADVFTKVLSVEQHNHLLSKLGVSKSFNSPLKEECKRGIG